MAQILAYTYHMSRACVKPFCPNCENQFSITDNPALCTSGPPSNFCLKPNLPKDSFAYCCGDTQPHERSAVYIFPSGVLNQIDWTPLCPIRQTPNLGLPPVQLPGSAFSSSVLLYRFLPPAPGVEYYWRSDFIPTGIMFKCAPEDLSFHPPEDTGHAWYEIVYQVTFRIGVPASSLCIVYFDIFSRFVEFIPPATGGVTCGNPYGGGCISLGPGDSRFVVGFQGSLQTEVCTDTIPFFANNVIGLSGEFVLTPAV